MQASNSLKRKQFSFRARMNSFRYAWEGIYNFFANEHNAWLHLAATIAVVMAAWYFKVSQSEVIALIIVTGFVWVAKIFNTAIEKIMDLMTPEYHPKVKLIKDMSAAGVLLAAFVAVLTGAFIFIPKFF